MSVKADLIEESALRQTRQGLEKVRIYRVDGLSGDASQREYEALTTGTVPAMDALHPTIPGIRVDERSVKADSHASAKVTIVYRTPSVDFSGGVGEPAVGDPPQIEVGATLQSISTQQNIDGEDLAVKYTISADDIKDNPGSGFDVGDEIDTVGTAQTQIPLVYVRYTRRETVSPGDNAKLYVGKTNTAPFLGDDANMWLCAGITGRSSDNGATYITTYEFQRAQNEEHGWNVIIRAEKDGKPMANPVEGVNIDDFNVYDFANFNDLGLA